MAKSRQGGLGRGLGSLIPADAGSDSDSPLRDVPVGDIVPNTYQPRRVFDEEELVSLSTSIRELGVLQPILVRQRPDKTYELIAGERRWRAASRAGLDRIPAIVRDVDDQTSLAHAIVENVQRAELNAIEEASAFQQLIEEFSLTQDDVAGRVGKSRPAITNALRLLQLPTKLQRDIIEGRLTAGHGRVLVGLDADEQGRFAARVFDEGLSVRALEALARGEDLGSSADSDDDTEASSGTDETEKAAAVGETKPAALLELEQMLEDRFETKVTISLGARRGRIAIDFADIDDLERIYSRMVGD